MDFVVLMFFLVVSGHSAQGASAHEALLGCWLSDDDHEALIHFTPKKCIFARLGKSDFQAARATYEAGKVKTESWGRRGVFNFAIEHDVLSLTNAGGKLQTFHRLDKIPLEVQPKALSLGTAGALSAEKTRTVQEELARRGKRDQEVRTDADQEKNMAEVDAANTAYLIKLVREIGWIDAARFGPTTSNEAFLIVQHSMHVPLMLAVLPKIEQDVKASRLDAGPYCLLYDRLQLILGERQRFGSQVGMDDAGELVVMPLEDREGVDDVRKEFGLSPLADYLRFFESRSGKPVRFLDDD